MIAYCYWEIGKIVLKLEKDNEFHLWETPHSFHIGSHGVVNGGEVDLNLQEAKSLVKQLEREIKQYEYLENGLKDIKESLK